MDLKKAGLHNLKIHYIWTFFSSVLFLAPIITLYYKYYGFDIQDILTFCHYKGKDDGKELLEDLHTYLPIYGLEEGEFLEIDID